MTLIAAVVLGLALGFFLGFTHRALVAFAAVWLAVLLVQSFLVLDDADVEDATYIPIQVVIFALGIGLLWLAAGARAWRAARAP